MDTTGEIIFGEKDRPTIINVTITSGGPKSSQLTSIGYYEHEPLYALQS